jgi:hypothetical protein
MRFKTNKVMNDNAYHKNATILLIYLIKLLIMEFARIKGMQPVILEMNLKAPQVITSRVKAIGFQLFEYACAIATL